MNFPKSLLDICKKLKDNDFEAYIVGGSVRDIIMKVEPQDYDICTNAKPEDIEHLFPNCYKTQGNNNRTDLGTRAVNIEGLVYEMTPYRTEGIYSDNRRPNAVEFIVDINRDLRRRDFTINGIALDVVTGQIIDPFNGQTDIQNKVLKCIGNPDDRFKEDALRILRAIRFSAKLDFIIEGDTRTSIIRNIDLLDNISNERKRTELMKIITANDLVSTMLDMLSTGVLDKILPELVKCNGIDQGKEHHKYDVFWHCVSAAQEISKDKTLLRFAALLHDIGKAETKSIVDGRTHFYDHEDLSAKMAKVIMERLKFSNEEIDYVCTLIKEHMIMYGDGWRDSTIKRLIRRVGEDKIYDLILLREADAKARKPNEYEHKMSELREKVDRILKEKEPIKIKNLAVNGSDIMDYLDIPPSKEVGEILKYLNEIVIDNPEYNNKEMLLEFAKKR